MTLQVNPIALGCMLVVAVGTLIYTYMTTRQHTPPQSHGGSGSQNYFDMPWPSSTSRSSSKSSLAEDSGQYQRKKNKDHCAICLGALTSTLKTLTCNHVFHSRCITTWLISNNSCPICRRETHL